MPVWKRFTRRFTHESNGEFDSFARLPDLILMDGGRGQVNIALKVLNDLGNKYSGLRYGQG